MLLVSLLVPQNTVVIVSIRRMQPLRKEPDSIALRSLAYYNVFFFLLHLPVVRLQCRTYNVYNVFTMQNVTYGGFFGRCVLTSEQYHNKENDGAESFGVQFDFRVVSQMGLPTITVNLSL